MGIFDRCFDLIIANSAAYRDPTAMLSPMLLLSLEEKTGPKMGCKGVF
jgi:hypothetical protein